MLFESAGDSNVDYRSLSWKSLVTRTSGVGFGSNLVGYMCTMCAIYPVNMSSIGGDRVLVATQRYISAL